MILVSLAARSEMLPPLVTGDESIVVTHHRVQTLDGPLQYEARAGRLAIRNDENGQVRAYIFFVAYVAQPKNGVKRPLTFLWNGGPTADSTLVHTEMFGPRRYTSAGMVDNAETLLSTSDLVFYDPVETGFSRPAQADDSEFLSTLGDFAGTAEFIRTYIARFSAEEQPLFLGGESYGTWRICGVAEILTKRGIKVSGAILISGGVPGSLMPPSFQDAMYVPARTAAAFELHRLAPEWMRDKQATMKAVAEWARAVYWPALDRIDKLSDVERESIASQLAAFIGVEPDKIDRKTLVMTNLAYRKGLFDGDPAKELNTYDMRISGKEPERPERARIVTAYLRHELGYNTDLAYSGLEDGYMPQPGPARRSTGDRWSYNHVAITPEAMARMSAGGGPPLSQPWLQNAMRLDKDIRVFVAAGRYDSLNMCEGNVLMSAKLEPDLARRFVHVCYEGGHMMYRDQATRLKMSSDIARFLLSR
jgi:carboxypeptidase C (cathepsin A)